MSQTATIRTRIEPMLKSEGAPFTGYCIRRFRGTADR
jgi:hypothetical protein